MKQHILLLASLAALAVAAPAPTLEKENLAACGKGMTLVEGLGVCRPVEEQAAQKPDTCFDDKTPTKTILPEDIPTGIVPPSGNLAAPQPRCDGGIELNGSCVCPAGTTRIEGGCTKNANAEADDEC
ncbi:uncharacterized protein G6M90_00g108030 [Metarhizium brunneum]|uniref:Uncharacterized protein n=1 Tax=Metarhizium brunneum TaxID=500148 RepID=A0A7D5V4J3_9HYPO